LDSQVIDFPIHDFRILPRKGHFAIEPSEVGGSLRDLQQLAGHASRAMMRRDIEGDSDAKRTLIQLI
jgi:hypothetical protein